MLRLAPVIAGAAAAGGGLLLLSNGVGIRVAAADMAARVPGTYDFELRRHDDDGDVVALLLGSVTIAAGLSGAPPGVGGGAVPGGSGGVVQVTLAAATPSITVVAGGGLTPSLVAALALSGFAAADGTPSDAVARSLDPYCHARAHTGYAGDGAAVWGLGPRGLHTADAGQCCEACKAHNAICGSPEANGKSWWPARPEMRCGRDVKRACTIWTFCPEERCFAFDIHKHEFGECWLKYQGDEPPYTRPKDPHFGHRTYPEIMRHAPRRKWPWAVDEKIWQGPMPLYVPWMSGVLADPSVSVVSSEPNDRWRERWCKKHGPCDGEPYA